MKILLYGETEKVGSGAWCYAETIKKMGISLICCSPNVHIKKYDTSLFHRILRRLNNRIVPQWDRIKHEVCLRDLAEKENPNIIIILKGLNISKKTVFLLKKYSKFVVNLNHDDFFSFNKNNWNQLQHQAIEAYDFIFVTREQNINEIRVINPNVELLMFAYYPDLHRIVAISEQEEEKYKAEVLFIGTYEKARADYLEKVLLLYSFDLAIYGEGWEIVKPHSVLYKHIRSTKGIWGGELAKAIQVANITLGFLRKENRDTYTQRSFEIPACGGLLLAEATDFHKKLYKEGQEAFFFDVNDPNSLVNSIKLLLKKPKQIISIKEKGNLKIVESKNRYEDRIIQIITAYHKKLRME